MIRSINFQFWLKKFYFGFKISFSQIQAWFQNWKQLKTKYHDISLFCETVSCSLFFTLIKSLLKVCLEKTTFFWQMGVVSLDRFHCITFYLQIVGVLIGQKRFSPHTHLIMTDTTDHVNSTSPIYHHLVNTICSKI